MLSHISRKVALLTPVVSRSEKKCMRLEADEYRPAESQDVGSSELTGKAHNLTINTRKSRPFSPSRYPRRPSSAVSCASIFLTLLLFSPKRECNVVKISDCIRDCRLSIDVFIRCLKAVRPANRTVSSLLDNLAIRPVMSFSP